MARFSLISHKTRIVLHRHLQPLSPYFPTKKGVVVVVVVVESGVCLCVTHTIQLSKLLATFHKGYEHHASGVHSKAMPFNFLRSIITTWRMLDFVMRKRTTEAYFFFQQYRNRPWKCV
jgi:hypothetical protein